MLLESKNKFNARKNQKGATLIIALVILLVMTIIGVASMKSSNLQERMSGNARQKTIAKNAALTAMREAEIWLQENVKDPAAIDQFGSNIAGLYAAVAPPNATKRVVTVDLTDPSDWSSLGVVSSAITSALVSQQPKYIIEYIGRDFRGAANSSVQMLDAEAKGNADLSPYFFRITAIGWGKDANIYSILESTYMTGYGTSNFVY